MDYLALHVLVLLQLIAHQQSPQSEQQHTSLSKTHFSSVSSTNNITPKQNSDWIERLVTRNKHL
ncbi:hypothetical protein GBA52_026007 [Prunus armeniaca]|nr:hypothetical protein GBA52_026007 [Prunus armeniaca]